MLCWHVTSSLTRARSESSMRRRVKHWRICHWSRACHVGLTTVVQTRYLLAVVLSIQLSRSVLTLTDPLAMEENLEPRSQQCRSKSAILASQNVSEHPPLLVQDSSCIVKGNHRNGVWHPSTSATADAVTGRAISLVDNDTVLGSLASARDELSPLSHRL